MATMRKLAIRKTVLLLLACITLLAALSPAALAAENGSIPENTFLKIDIMNNEQRDVVQTVLDASNVNINEIPVFHVWIKNPESGIIEVRCATLVADPVNGGMFLITPTCKDLLNKGYVLKRVYNNSFDKITPVFLGDDGVYSYLNVEGIDSFTPLVCGTEAKSDFFGVTLLAKSKLELEGMGVGRFDTRNWLSDDDRYYYFNGVDAQKGFIPGGPVISLDTNKVVGFTSGEESGKLMVCLRPDWTPAQEYSIGEFAPQTNDEDEEPLIRPRWGGDPAKDDESAEKEPVFTKKEKIIIVAGVVAVIIIAAAISAKASKNRGESGTADAAEVPGPAFGETQPGIPVMPPVMPITPTPKKYATEEARIIAVRDLNGKVYRSDGSGRMTFGRDPKSTVFFDTSHDSISIAHCVLYHENGKLFLKDTNSTNGTYFSPGERIKADKAYPVSKGESFYLTDGRYKFTIVEG